MIAKLTIEGDTAVKWNRIGYPDGRLIIHVNIQFKRIVKAIWPETTGRVLITRGLHAELHEEAVVRSHHATQRHSQECAVTTDRQTNANPMSARPYRFRTIELSPKASANNLEAL